jgi:hypothetical protein
VLVYIPCHKDFYSALSQVERLRDDFQKYLDRSQGYFQRLHVVVSVNNFEPSLEDKLHAEGICDEVYYYGKALLADVNISEGFMVALRQDHDIFWILSTNDVLIAGALERVLAEFESDLTLDLVIANLLERQGPHIEKDISKVSGLISGVIYRTTNLIAYFNVAPFFPWTGWSHLSVIQSAMKGNHGLRVSTLPSKWLYTQTERDLLHNGYAYSHSFLGGLIQGFLFMETGSQRRKFLRNFVRKNFFKSHLYNQRDARRHQITNLVNPDHYLSWNKLIAESLIKSYTPFTYLFYLASKRIPFEKGKDNRILRLIRERL